jgi:hypothetical protein
VRCTRGEIYDVIDPKFVSYGATGLQSMDRDNHRMLYILWGSLTGFKRPLTILKSHQMPPVMFLAADPECAGTIPRLALAGPLRI